MSRVQVEHLELKKKHGNKADGRHEKPNRKPDKKHSEKLLKSLFESLTKKGNSKPMKGDFKGL